MNNIKQKYHATITDKTLYARQYYLKNKRKKQEYYNSYYYNNKDWIKDYRKRRAPKLPQVFIKEIKETIIKFN